MLRWKYYNPLFRVFKRSLTTHKCSATEIHLLLMWTAWENSAVAHYQELTEYSDHFSIIKECSAADKQRELQQIKSVGGVKARYVTIHYTSSVADADDIPFCSGSTPRRAAALSAESSILSSAWASETPSRFCSRSDCSSTSAELLAAVCVLTFSAAGCDTYRSHPVQSLT